jgi:hypothetical protein
VGGGCSSGSGGIGEQVASGVPANDAAVLCWHLSLHRRLLGCIAVRMRHVYTCIKSSQVINVSIQCSSEHTGKQQATPAGCQPLTAGPLG